MNNASLFGDCLRHSYRNHQWSYVPNMFITEILTSSKPVVIDQTLSFADHTWSLESMIVFNCSHFVAYMRLHDNEWYIYDDVRSLHNKALNKVDLSHYLRLDTDDAETLNTKLDSTSDDTWCYAKNGCQFHPGVHNTFVVYIQQTSAGRTERSA